MKTKEKIQAVEQAPQVIQTSEGTRFSFIAIDSYVEKNIVTSDEKQERGRDFVSWGTMNRYPDFLLSLYQESTTLRSIINGCVDYVAGEDVTATNLCDTGLNEKGQKPREIVRNLAKDYFLYGGFAIQVVRNMEGKICGVFYVDMHYLRSNKLNDVFFYSEDWRKRWGKVKDVTYPKFVYDHTQIASSILYVKNVDTKTYPETIWAGAVKAADIERCIDNYHLNAINNDFASSKVVNFNGRVATPEIQEEVERTWLEKFTGHQNAGRMAFCWNPDIKNRTTIEDLSVTDFGTKYESLAKWSRQELFTAFRANPNLFGIPTDNNGFSNEEYEASFKLFNKTMIKPAQTAIVEAFEQIYKGSGSLVITPFNLEA